MWLVSRSYMAISKPVVFVDTEYIGNRFTRSCNDQIQSILNWIKEPRNFERSYKVISPEIRIMLDTFPDEDFSQFLCRKEDYELAQFFGFKFKRDIVPPPNVRNSWTYYSWFLKEIPKWG